MLHEIGAREVGFIITGGCMLLPRLQHVGSELRILVNTKALDYLIPPGYKNEKGLNNTYPIPFN